MKIKSNYSYQDLKAALVKIGITKGDNIFIHSNIGFFGRMEGVITADEMCEKYITVLKEAVGAAGTIVFPTFSYSFCHGEKYNPLTTKSDCGMLADYSYTKSDFIRSSDPNFSISVWGKNTELYVKNPPQNSFGKNSFWERWLKTGGRLVCLNFDCGSTFIHYIEHFYSVPYRYNKAFNGVMEINGKLKKDYAVHYVHDGGDDAPCMDRLNEVCKENGIVKTACLGKGTLLSIDINEYFDLITKTLKHEPRFLTVGGQL